MKLKEIKNQFKKSGFEPIEAEVAACQILGLTRSELYLADELDARWVNQVLKKRKKGQPLNLVLGTQNFYGYDFLVNKHVLKPRQETEILVKQAMSFISSCQSPNVLDLCTGSGAVGLTLLLEKSDINLTLADISFKALKIAKKNAKKFKANCKFIKSDLFKNLNGQLFDIIVCNPPYIKSSDIKDLQVEVKKFDPIISLNGGDDGLMFYKRIEKELAKFLKPSGAAFFEIGFDQADSVKEIFKNFKTKVIKDLSGNDRIIEVRIC